jgi:hypothetical protein
VAGSTGGPLINHRDGRFTSGRVGLWTKADSITAFDSLAITQKTLVEIKENEETMQ